MIEKGHSVTGAEMLTVRYNNIVLWLCLYYPALISSLAHEAVLP